MYDDQKRILSHCLCKVCETLFACVVGSHFEPGGGGGGGGGGRLLAICVPMRKQMTAKLTLNTVFDILKLIPLFTVSSQKVTLSSVVN